MRYLAAIISFYLLIMAITSVCGDASSASSASSSFRKLSVSYKSQQGIQNPKGSHFGSVEQAAGRGVQPTNQESEAYSTETQNSNNLDAEDIVYHIDYHGATTHPTPTPKHPKP